MTHLEPTVGPRTGDPGVMQSLTEPTELADLVVFDVPTVMLAEELVRRLEERWSATSFETPWGAAVDVVLPASAGHELGPLLREVEDWAADQAFRHVPFWIDGRDYVLIGRGAALPGVL
jgi:hypothetical protein